MGQIIAASEVEARQLAYDRLMELFDLDPEARSYFTVFGSETVGNRWQVHLGVAAAPETVWTVEFVDGVMQYGLLFKTGRDRAAGLYRLPELPPVVDQLLNVWALV